MLQVIEEFISVNGEGLRSGELAYFIRLSECNLSCSWCDTKWSQKGAAFTPKSVETLAQSVVESGVYNVTLTGGEPLLQKEVIDLINKLLETSYIQIEIETNGSVPLEPIISQIVDKSRVCFTVDYKLPSSGMNDKMHLENYNNLTSNDVVKCVIQDEVDLTVALDFIQAYKLNETLTVILSPCYESIAPALMVERIKDLKLNRVRVQMQLHKWIWDPNMRGV